MPLLKKVKDFFGFEIPSLDEGISPERENEIIEKAAKLISRMGMEYPAYFFVSSLVPVSSLVAHLYVYTSAPLLELFGIKGYEYAAFLNKRENVQRLMNRIEELMKSKKESGS